MKFVSVASLLVLASSASAFVPSAVPLRTWYVLSCGAEGAPHRNNVWSPQVAVFHDMRRRTGDASLFLLDLRDSTGTETEFIFSGGTVDVHSRVSRDYSLQFDDVSLDAKHANDKAAKKANANRPRKSRPSDIKRKPTNYPTFDKPPEYTISEN
ncbi:hypothetical protein ACHAWU_000933 [Discostella pseudostelligera]|uniref:Uncharacterized protein n=1 Tax=Discostella pseudostelligera TaxID=259834 RepID=A0ABD3MDY1_9STRA